MYKFILLFIIAFGITSAQWVNGNPWPNSNYKGGSHGIAVSPDGKVWQTSYYQTNWNTPSGNSIPTSPIFVFDSTGVALDTLYAVTDGTVTDTLSGNARGIGVDELGNIIYVHSAPSKAIKINYKTMERMASKLLIEIGSSPTKPVVSSSGDIFIGPVSDTNTVIGIYNSKLQYQGKALDGPLSVSRTMEVSPDGNTIYWMSFNSQKTYVYTRDNDFSNFALSDSMFIGMSIESSAWQPGTNSLWISNDNRGSDKTKRNLTWYGYDMQSKTFVDSLSVKYSGFPDEFPRAIDFSPDGKTAYVGLFGRTFDRIYKFRKDTNGVNVEELPGTIPNNIELAQNYPNPFNPTTSISFSIPKSDVVTLRVFDMLGRQVAELLNEQKSAGNYKATFDASNLASGSYVYMLKVGNATISKKMLLLK